ncbi:radical SAM protein [Lonsdalea populi]|uniref:radical SAM protein n=1 Tax=Lonsdalea populi TaxID=1172565 RepID=UPI000A24741E|nr:radical SAM protein [Lonsdalea populi]OSM96822.1 hypothetical protein AU508_07565 [Lonsdalea populi]RAT68224.1 hypothetical protein AU505_15280 [Lonsdalea populi]RAT69531.1 hypothetical protein AU504_10685 [Lonsdalea populi]RAT75333.1 hypothetical protein AU506_09795 [Lonsdalea populi]RAT77800.1 hypothetical protein AU507_11215 [Lonsdalea populi]
MYLLHGNAFTKQDVYFALRDRNLLTLTIMLENVCNFKCPFCYTQTQKFDNELSTGEIKQMVDDGLALGIKTVLIAGAGEPLLARNFWEVIDYIGGKGLHCIVFSNMTAITGDTAQKLYARDVSIIGKINSFKDEVQNEIVGGIHNAASKMRRGLKNLMDAGFNRLEKGKTRLAIETSVLPENIDEIYDIWRYCRSHTIFPLVDTVLYEGGAKQHRYEDFLVPYTRLVEEVSRIRQYDRDMGFEWPIKIIKRENDRGIIVGELAGDCHRIGTNLNVNSIGDVYDCFNMSQPTYGNIRERTLIEIWNADRPDDKALRVHGLCHCRHLDDRESLKGEMACLSSAVS